MAKAKGACKLLCKKILTRILGPLGPPPHCGVCGVTIYATAVIINRLQIGHTRAAHAHLLGDDDEAACTTCYTSLTVNHILTECPQFNHLRQQYHFGTTLKDLFNNTSVNDIIAFMKDTHVYTRI